MRLCRERGRKIRSPKPRNPKEVRIPKSEHLPVGHHPKAEVRTINYELSTINPDPDPVRGGPFIENLIMNVFFFFVLPWRDTTAGCPLPGYGGLLTRRPSATARRAAAKQKRNRGGGLWFYKQVTPSGVAKINPERNPQQVFYSVSTLRSGTGFATGD